MKDLRQLFIHIDMPGASRPSVWASRDEEALFWECRNTIDDRAQMLAAGLSTTHLEELYILHRYDEYTTNWAAWEITHGGDEGEGGAAICTRIMDWDIRCVLNLVHILCIGSLYYFHRTENGPI